MGRYDSQYIWLHDWMLYNEPVFQNVFKIKKIEYFLSNGFYSNPKKIMLN